MKGQEEVIISEPSLKDGDQQWLIFKIFFEIIYKLKMKYEKFVRNYFCKNESDHYVHYG